MIQDNLEKEIDSFYDIKRNRATVIIMNPATWKDIIRESIASESFAIYDFNVPQKYAGIKVLRSFDVAQGFFYVR